MREVYEAQKHDPIEGDYIELVLKDANEIGVVIDENKMSKMKKEDFKNVVKTKVRHAALKYLNNLKQKHSKVRNIIYTELELQTYLKSPVFTSDNNSTLYALRTRTVRGIRSDFGQMYEDHSCPLGCGDTDNLPNIIKCSVLNNRLQSDSLATDCIRYEDVFSKDVLKQKEVTQLYTQLLRIRDEILTSSASNDAGQCINLQECDVSSVT